MNPKIKYANIDDLYLDPTNPRLGRNVASPKLSQEEILEAMRDWALDELAVSFLESGFWPLEALIIIEEPLYGEEHLVVIEGNRRLASLKLLKRTINGDNKSAKWKGLIKDKELPPQLFQEVPYIEVKDRKSVASFLGFRHVTGIKEWNPAEKAQYIAKLIEEDQLSYDEVRRKIGSKTPTVRQNYIAYRLLLQMEDREDIDIESVEDKFSVLYLSLRTAGVQQYLGLNNLAAPDEAKLPVSKDNLNNLANYSKWVFGDKKERPLFTDSRKIDEFGKILENHESVEYLERTDSPRFEMAYRLAGLGEDSIVESVLKATDNVQLALQEAHRHKKSDRVVKVVQRLSVDVMQLASIFPSVISTLKEQLEDADTA